MARYDVNRFGRFSSPDALSGSALDAQSLNHYSYTENDPVNAADPSGMVTVPLVFLSGGFDQGGFDDLWNEFDFMDVQIGTLYHFTGTLNYSNYDLQDMQNFASQGEISESTEPIYASFLIDPGDGGGGGAYAAAQMAKQRILRIFQQKPDCADLFGGLDKATSTLNKMNIVDVPETPAVLTDPAQASAWNAIAQSNAGQNNLAAETAWYTPAGQTIGWNGGNFNTYIGSNFAGQSSSMQTAILMHEMAHPTTGYPSNYGVVDGLGVIDQPNSPYSPQSLLENCVK